MAPWERYQKQGGQAGPWQKYTPSSPANDDWSARSEADQIEKWQDTGTFSDMTGSGMAKAIPFADEIVSGLNAPFRAGREWMQGEGFDIGRAYDRNMQVEEELQRRREERSPIASTAGTVAGGMGAASPLMKGGFSLIQRAKPTLGSLVTRGAGEGAAYGAVYGAGEGRGAMDRFGKAATGTVIGGTLGGAVGGAASRQLSKAATRAAPTTDALKQQAHELYQQADNAGLVVSRQGITRVFNDIAETVKNAGIDKTIHPKATAALGRLQEAAEQGAGLSLREVDTLRRVVGGAAKSIDPDERRIATIMIDKIDDWLGNLRPTDVAAGNAKAASENIAAARDMWRTFRKSEIIENAFEKAKNTVGANYTSADMATALRQQFKSILGNVRTARNFSKAELDIIRGVVRGGPVENALRLLGKFAPRGVVSTTLAGSAGYGAAGPVGAAALLGAGEVGRRAAGSIGVGNAERAAALIRSGGALPPPQMSPQLRGLLDLLTIESGQQVPRLAQ